MLYVLIGYFKASGTLWNLVIKYVLTTPIASIALFCVHVHSL